MVKFLPILVIGLGLMIGTAAEAKCSRAPIQGVGQALPAQGDLDVDLLDATILAEVNYRRCLIGREALSPLSQLRVPAHDHSLWMANASTLSHRSDVTGRATLKDRIIAAGLRPRAASENLALLPIYNLTPRFRVVDQARCRFATPGGKSVGLHSYASFAFKVVDIWMDSPGHRRNLVSRKTTHLASAAAINPESNYCGDIYVTQIFVG